MKVLRGKYGCTGQGMIKPRKKKESSLIWRGIMKLCWHILTNTAFWTDTWSETNAPLMNLIPGLEDRVNRKERVNEYVMWNGEWDEHRLRTWLPNHIVHIIISVNPPCEARGEDKFIWKPASDGQFTVKSAYKFHFAGIHQEEDSLWKMIW